MIERDLRMEANGVRLAGTLCSPAAEGAFPVVLMLHGTGPLDRDENMKGQRLDVFNAIAHRLAAAGVASVRYDKRGCGESTGDYLRAGQADLIADAVAWLDRLSADGFRRIYLLGHSEGCLIAPRVSLQRQQVAGLVLLCPVLAPLETLLMQQAEHMEREIGTLPGVEGVLLRLLTKLFGRATELQRRTLLRLRSTSEPVLRIGLQKTPARSLRDLLALDMRPIFADVRCPMLLIAGANDVQCVPGDAPAIAAICSGAEAHIIPDLTHILRRDERPGSIFRYRELLSQPIDAHVLDLIAEWVGRQPATAGP